MDKTKVKKLLKLMWMELNLLKSSKVINNETFELLELNIDEIEKEIDKQTINLAQKTQRLW